MHIAIITAGGAGMFCGSCMHDNTWARGLIAAGAEVSLIPTYTPIRVDEANLSQPKVYFGGINVYLDSMLPFWQRLPRPLTRWLDSPALIRLATRFSISNEASRLGKLTLDMLAADQGPHRAAGEELAAHIAQLRPDVVIFSNALLSGALPALRRQFSGPVLCTLQGDDVFLDGLQPPTREQAISRISELAGGFSGFLVHSDFYRDAISRMLRLPADKFHRLPLGIDLSGHHGQPGERPADAPPTVGYFARIAPEKGLHHLAHAFLKLHQRLPSARLKVGGYLGPPHQRYFDDVRNILAPVGDAFHYAGSPDSLAGKVDFYRSVDLLSVPTEFQEPKGLYVLEALANGVPVVQPQHGAFPELLTRTRGGKLVPSRDPQALSDALYELLTDRQQRLAHARQGQQNVRELFSVEKLAEETLAILGTLRG